MNIASNYEQLVKILILGDSNVGKTNFLLRYTENNFVENYITTIGFDYKSSIAEIENKKIKLQIWDTAGQERFMSVTRNLLIKVQGIIVMYDITSLKSFENTEKWISSIKENANNNIPIMIIGNKCDLEANRQVPLIKLKELANEYGIEYAEGSAKDDINVVSTFVALAKIILKNNHSDGSYIALNKQKKKSKGCC
jgi:small GTP-binding protein